MRDLFPKVIGVESITDFGQDDADCYTLDVTTEDGEIVLVMGTLEAVRLHNLLVKQMGEYVAEMNEARASYERGEGPNGEKSYVEDEADLEPWQRSNFLEMADNLRDWRRGK